MGTTVDLDGGSGHLAIPPSGSGPGIIVIQEWWGLNDQIRATADHLAADGFVALAPDLYRLLDHTNHHNSPVQIIACP